MFICLFSCAKHSEIDHSSFKSKSLNFYLQGSRYSVFTRAENYQEYSYNVVSQEGDSLMVELGVGDNIFRPTKGDVMTTATLYDTIGIVAYQYPSTEQMDKNKQANAMVNNISVRENHTSQIYMPQYDLSTFVAPFIWETEKMSFFAYAPVENLPVVTMKHPAKLNDTGYPQFLLDVPTKVEEQKDFVVANTIDITRPADNTVPLQFYHAQSAVKFITGSDIKIKQIEITQLKGVATITLANNTNDYTYEYDVEETSGVKNYTLSIDPPAALPETDNSNIFFLVPQELTGSSNIVITAIISTGEVESEKTLTIPITELLKQKDGTPLLRIKPNTIYEIKINKKSYNSDDNLSCTPVLEFPASGSTKPFELLYNKVPIPASTEGVQVEVSLDNGSTWTTQDVANNWFYIKTDKNTLGAMPSPFIEVRSESDPYLPLRSLPLHGSASKPWNLSNANGEDEVQNTANTYIIKGPGYYRFPTVYGNGIKNSALNLDAFIAGIDEGDYILSTFLNPLGQPIYDPYIQNCDGCNPSVVQVQWQTSSNLISNLKYSEGFVYFEVTAENIAEGNAVIALKDDKGQVLWGWNLWVTTLKAGAEDVVEVKSADETKTINVARYSLGRTNKYLSLVKQDSRDALVKFTYNSKSVQMQVKQLPSEPSYNQDYNKNGACYYQWGRPFAMLQSVPGQDKFVSYYDSANNFNQQAGPTYPLQVDMSNESDNRKILIEGLNNVGKLINFGQSVSTNQFINLWNINMSEDSPVKTIYDPCPIGLRVPTEKESHILFDKKMTADLVQNAFVLDSKDKLGRKFKITCWGLGKIMLGVLNANWIDNITWQGTIYQIGQASAYVNTQYPGPAQVNAFWIVDNLQLGANAQGNYLSLIPLSYATGYDDMKNNPKMLVPVNVSQNGNPEYISTATTILPVAE